MPMIIPRAVTLVEVGPRDGLQNEKAPIDCDTKVELCKRLIQAGVQRLEAAAFVSPKWVPQMADGSQVLERLGKPCGPSGNLVSLSALVPNLKGMEAALQAGIQEAVVFTAASEAFTQKNINCTIEESIDRFRPVVEMAIANGVHVRGSISCALGCPYQGDVPVNMASEVGKRLADIGVSEFDIADTIGIGTAGRVQAVFEQAAKVLGVERLAGHFHDTYGQALANILAAMQVGVAVFHSSIAGLGGCPYAKGATGNVATEDVVYMLEGLGVETGLSLDGLVKTGHWISTELGRPVASRAGRALWNRAIAP